MRKLLTFAPVFSPQTTDWKFKPSNNSNVKLESIVTSLTTSAVVANRSPTLIVTGPDNLTLSIDVTETAQVASTTVNYSFRPGNINYGASAAPGVVASSCPGFWLPPGSTVQVNTLGKDAGDAWQSAIVCYYVDDELLTHEVEAEIIAAQGGQ